MGSKNRIAKYILPIILKNKNEDRIFYDVCCGGANLIDKVKGCRRIGIDNNEYLIECLKMIRDNPNQLPKNKEEVSEIKYKNMKNSNDKAMKGYYGFALSFGGKWFGGYRRDKIGNRDYIKESYNSAIKQSINLKGVEFICANYYEIEYVNNSIIYIDPPYHNTTKYIENFEYDKFWQWCRDMSEKCEVYISEYNAPDDFICIWEKEIKENLNSNRSKGNIKIEKLFIYKSLDKI